MGITVKEMLNSEFFKDYKVLAGHKGLDNQIQGLAVLDAPDGYKWTKGREFVISSGFVFKVKPEFLGEYLNSEEMKKQAAFGIKVDRYLKSVSQEMLKTFDDNNVPLIDIPSKYSWMEIYNAINVLVMNKNIRQFNIGKIRPMNFSDLTYRVRKINTILSALEYEMNFPAMLYDLMNEKAYYSSNKFKELSKDFKIEDFWNPSFNYSKEFLCDNLKMSRYRFFDDKYDKPYSWITVPIVVSDKIRAYFVVMEATELIDYFDQFAIRIGFIQLQAIYEQILVAQSLGYKGFSSFVNEIISGKLKDKNSIADKASELDIDVNDKYYMCVMEQSNCETPLIRHDDILTSNLRKSFGYNECRIAFIEDNKCVFLYKIDEKILYKQELEVLLKKILNFSKRLDVDLEKEKFIFGLSDIGGYIYEAERNYNRCLKTLKVGPCLCSDSNLWLYSQLGAFAWIDVKDDELNLMMNDIKILYKNDKDGILIETLRTYLECKMNFSLTAERLYLHINTVRRRIEKILNLIDVDLNDATSRLKIELLLKLI